MADRLLEEVFRVVKDGLNHIRNGAKFEITPVELDAAELRIRRDRRNPERTWKDFEESMEKFGRTLPPNISRIFDDFFDAQKTIWNAPGDEEETIWNAPGDEEEREDGISESVSAIEKLLLDLSDPHRHEFIELLARRDEILEAFGTDYVDDDMQELRMSRPAGEMDDIYARFVAVVAEAALIRYAKRKGMDADLCCEYDADEKSFYFIADDEEGCNAWREDDLEESTLRRCIANVIRELRIGWKWQQMEDPHTSMKYSLVMKPFDLDYEDELTKLPDITAEERRDRAINAENFDMFITDFFEACCESGERLFPAAVQWSDAAEVINNRYFRLRQDMESNVERSEAYLAAEVEARQYSTFKKENYIVIHGEELARRILGDVLGIPEFMGQPPPGRTR